MKHFRAMNGCSGCMPDSNMVCDSVNGAINSLINLLELTPSETSELETNHIVYFRGERIHEVGAGYAEVCDCEDDDCLEESRVIFDYPEGEV